MTRRILLLIKNSGNLFILYKNKDNITKKFYFYNFINTILKFKYKNINCEKKLYA